MKNNLLYSKIYTEILNALEDILQQTQDQHLFILGLGMVEDFCGFFIVGNTCENLNENDDVYDLWWIPEWPYESKVDAGVNKEIRALEATLGDDPSDEQRQKLKHDYENTIIRVIQDLKKEGRLENKQHKELIMVIQYADSSDEDFEELSFAQINPDKLMELYQNRFIQDPSKPNINDWIKANY